MKSILIGCVAAASLFGFAAQAETYVCKIKANGSSKGFFISDKITIDIPNSSQKAVVSDAVIMATNDVPVTAKLTTRSTKRVSLRWSLFGVKGPLKEIYGKVDYKLVIWKSRGNKASIVVGFPSAGGTDETLTKETYGSGTCQMR